MWPVFLLMGIERVHSPNQWSQESWRNSAELEDSTYCLVTETTQGKRVILLLCEARVAAIEWWQRGGVSVPVGIHRSLSFCLCAYHRKDCYSQCGLVRSRQSKVQRFRGEIWLTTPSWKQPRPVEELAEGLTTWWERGWWVSIRPQDRLPW